MEGQLAASAAQHPQWLSHPGRRHRCVIHDDRGRRSVSVRAYVPQLQSFVIGHPNFGKALDSTLSVVDMQKEKFTCEPSALPLAAMGAATESVGTFTHVCAVCMCTHSRRQMADFCFTAYRVGAHDEDRGESRHPPQICVGCMRRHVALSLDEGKLAVRCPVEGCGRSLQTRELKEHATAASYEALLERLQAAEDAHDGAEARAAAAEGEAAGLELRQCPRCKVLIEKNKGCMTLRCYRCDNHFEWAKAPRPGDADGRRRWGPRGIPVVLDENGQEAATPISTLLWHWARWAARLLMLTVGVALAVYCSLRAVRWLWNLGWRKYVWYCEALGTSIMLGTVLYRLYVDWRLAAPRRNLPWMQRVRLQFARCRARAMHGWPEDPARAIEYMTQIVTIVPLLLKAVWLSSLFNRSDFIHLNTASTAQAAAAAIDATPEQTATTSWIYLLYFSVFMLTNEALRRRQRRAQDAMQVNHERR